MMGDGLPTVFRIFRSAKPLKDPVTGEVLGYEGEYVGRAELVRSESEADQNDAGQPDNAPAVSPTAGDAPPPPPEDAKGESGAAHAGKVPVPATLDMISSKEEISVGNRLLPEPPRVFRSYVPHAPDTPVDARVIKAYGNSSALYAGKNSIVVINKGLKDGLEDGDVLALLSAGPKVVDTTDHDHTRIKLPDERNGLAMVFLPFDRVSYVLIMQATREVQAGDRLINPK
jgi:hypothetical protein